MCVLLPGPLTAKRRLRLSSQYLRCQTAKKVFHTLSKINAPCEGRRSVWVSARRRGALYRGVNFFPQHLFSQKCRKTIFFSTKSYCTSKTPIKPWFLNSTYPQTCGKLSIFYDLFGLTSPFSVLMPIFSGQVS